MNQITSRKITTPKEFLSYYDEIGTSYYSSGLLRGKREMVKKYKIILAIIKTVKDNRNLNPGALFNKVLPKVKKADRYGINGLTELMNTYNPKKYSVANGRTIKSLHDLGFQMFPSPNNFDAPTYERYNHLIASIANAAKLNDLGHVDHFLSWY